MKTSIQLNWVKTGIICSFIALITYPVLLLISMPTQITLVLAFSFGVLLMIGLIGIYQFVSLNKKTVSSQIGGLLCIIGCSVVTMMFTIQFALYEMKQRTGTEIAKELKSFMWQIPNTIQLGLDVVWDIFVATGTVLLALNMLRHPRLGKIFGITGVLIAVALLVLNIIPFPIPPAESDSVDIGPLMALWYLAVTIQMARSLKWANEAVTA